MNKYNIIRYFLAGLFAFFSVYNIIDIVMPNKYLSYFHNEYDKNSNIGRYSFTIKYIQSTGIKKEIDENIEYFIVSNEDDHYIVLESNVNNISNIKVGDKITVDVLSKYTDSYKQGTLLNFTSAVQTKIVDYYSLNLDITKSLRISRIISTETVGKFYFMPIVYSLVCLVIAIVSFPKNKANKKRRV